MRKFFRRGHPCPLDTFLLKLVYFSQKTGFYISCKLDFTFHANCLQRTQLPEILFSRRNKKNIINLLSADIQIVFLFFPENRIWYFMQIVSSGDNLYEMSNPVFCFLGKNNKNNNNNKKKSQICYLLNYPRE